MTAHVVLYHTASCPYCVRAERLLEAKGVKDIERIRVDLDPEQRAIMMQRTGRRTVPRSMWATPTWAASTTCTRSTRRAAWTRC
jgi:hypothetical protein